MQGQYYVTITNKCRRKVSIKLRLVYPVQWIFLLSIPWLNTGSFRAFGIQLLAGCIFGRLGPSESYSHLLFNNNWSAVDSYLILIHQSDNENVEMLFRSARTSCTSFHGPVRPPVRKNLSFPYFGHPTTRVWTFFLGQELPLCQLEDRVCIGQKLGWRSWPWTKGPSWWSSRCSPPTPCPWVTRCTSRGRLEHIGRLLWNPACGLHVEASTLARWCPSRSCQAVAVICKTFGFGALWRPLKGSTSRKWT